MKYFIFLQIFLLGSLAEACYINNELMKVIKNTEPNPVNIRLAATDQIHDWNSNVGFYVTFSGSTKDYAGYLSFDQTTCLSSFSDIKELPRD